MSTRLPKAIAKTPRKIGKSEKFDNEKTKNEPETITCDYDEAAFGQPDLTGFFKKNEIISSAKTNFRDDAVNEKTTERSVELGEKISEKIAQPENEKINDTDSAMSGVCPKSEYIERKKCEKISEIKTAKTSKIPRARYTGFSRPLRNKAKKLSMTRLCATKSKSVIAGEARQEPRAIETAQPSENIIQDRRLSDDKITLVVAASKSIFSEEKCSGIEADVELDPEHEFTTSTDNSPGRIINTGEPLITSILRASKLSCACRSCHNNTGSVFTGHRVNTEIWTDSRSSPDVGRYASSGRNGRPKSRRFPGISKSRGYLDETTDESDIESTTDFSNYEENRKKITTRRENSSEIPRPVGIVAKTSITASPTTRIRSRSRMRFSFFNTLFDIVFWPFIFLRNDT